MWMCMQISFKGGDRVVEIPIDESHRFIYQLPVVRFRLTDEQDGRLRGFWCVTQFHFKAFAPHTSGKEYSLKIQICLFVHTQKVEEIFSYTRDELTTEDVLILDCHTKIYVWVSHNSVVKSKQQALSIGLAFLEKDVLGECLSVDTPIYVVTEGHEPPFFTRFFDWDASKANMLGNSFERKLAILKGQTQKLEVRPDSLAGVNNNRCNASSEEEL
ncbi:putative villin/Gelsolin, ADF-H/Gelsolin-like domain superfamily [Helianthus debilis subsp. tardiflorus]